MLGSTFSGTQLKRMFLIFLSFLFHRFLTLLFHSLSLRKSSAFLDAIPIFDASSLPNPKSTQICLQRAWKWLERIRQKYAE